jgi:hypothetical protein
MKRILFAVCIGEYVPALQRVEILRERKGGAFVAVSADETRKGKDPDKTTAKNFGHLPTCSLQGLMDTVYVFKNLTGEKGSSSSMRIWLITSLSRKPCFPARMKKRHRLILF